MHRWHRFRRLNQFLLALNFTPYWVCLKVRQTPWENPRPVSHALVQWGNSQGGKSLGQIACAAFGAVHLEKLFRADGEVIGWAATAQDVPGIGRIVDPVAEQALVDVHANHLAKHHPGVYFLALQVLHLQDLRAAAFKADWALQHPGHAQKARGGGGQTGQGKFVHLGGHALAGLVHGFGQGARDQIPDKFAVGFDVVQRVLAPDAGKADQRRHVVEGVEETVGRQVQHAFGTAGGDPANGPRPHDGVEGVVFQAMAQAGFVKVRHADTIGKPRRQGSHAPDMGMSGRGARLDLAPLAGQPPHQQAACLWEPACWRCVVGRSLSLAGKLPQQIQSRLSLKKTKEPDQQAFMGSGASGRQWPPWLQGRLGVSRPPV